MGPDSGLIEHEALGGCRSNLTEFLNITVVFRRSRPISHFLVVGSRKGTTTSGLPAPYTVALPVAFQAEPGSDRTVVGVSKNHGHLVWPQHNVIPRIRAPKQDPPPQFLETTMLLAGLIPPNDYLPHFLAVRRTPQGWKSSNWWQAQTSALISCPPRQARHDIEGQGFKLQGCRLRGANFVVSCQGPNAWSANASSVRSCKIPRPVYVPDGLKHRLHFQEKAADS